MRRSIQFEALLVAILELRILLGLASQAIAHREQIDLGAHEASERILGCGNDPRWLSRVSGLRGAPPNNASKRLLVIT